MKPIAEEEEDDDDDGAPEVPGTTARRGCLCARPIPVSESPPVRCEICRAS